MPLKHRSVSLPRWMRPAKRRCHAVLALAILAATLLCASDAAANPLNRLQNCTLVPTDWADGDSFRVRTESGDEHTIRLYGADCIEWHVTDESDARRLREQRRYFGISETGGSPEESIRLAKQFGERAAAAVRDLLREPFTVFTAYSDARGDGRYKRIYGFVVTADGRDLAETLVLLGLARAFGVSRETYNGMTRDEYRERLKDLELIAARENAGVWSHTIWKNLPEERRQQREDEREMSLATGTAPLRLGELLDPNLAARDELMRLPGVGEALASRIIEGRPYETLDDLLRVNGIGESKFSKMKIFLTLP